MSVLVVHVKQAVLVVVVRVVVVISWMFKTWNHASSWISETGRLSAS